MVMVKSFILVMACRRYLMYLCVLMVLVVGLLHHILLTPSANVGDREHHANTCIRKQTGDSLAVMANIQRSFYNYIIGNMTELVLHRKFETFQYCIRDKSHVLRANRETYFSDILSTIPSIKTVYLEESSHSMRKILRTSYFPPSSNNCTLLELRANGSPGINTTGCVDEIASQPVLMPADKWSDRFPPKPHVADDTGVIKWTYIHVIKNAVISDSGDVITLEGTKLVPNRCLMTFGNSNIACINITNNITHDEVFTISQFWGTAFFHGAVENLPRIALYLDFLRENPHIKIHVASLHPFFSVFGLDSRRVISKYVI